MRRDVAALACLCKSAAAAQAASKWHAAVRVGPGGFVLEPASGTFDVTVTPGEPVQDAVSRCPPGGSVLLLPGTHAGPLMLEADTEVYVFGRGCATLRAADGNVLTSSAAKAALDGLVIRREAGGALGYGVWINGGRLRLQACDVTSASHSSVLITNGADPVVSACRCWPRYLDDRGALS